MAFIATPSFHPFPLGMAVFALLQWGKTTQGGSSMRTFLEYYRRSIQPQIEMIDIFLNSDLDLKVITVCYSDEKLKARILSKENALYVKMF